MRLGRIGRSLVPVVLVAGLPLAIQGAAASAASRGAIKAVVLKSWNLCLQMDMWSDLNTNWSNYGSVPVSIDYSNTNLCQGTITYDALVASRADVMILSDSAGGLQEYSRDEIAAIRQYAREGHSVLGTYLVFAWSDVHNESLGPIFGISAANTYQDGPQYLTPTYQLRFPDDPLFRNVPNPYVSSGYPESQVPSDGHWATDDLFGGAGVALADHARGTIVLYRAPTYDAIYISSFPEYEGSTIDEQWYYNALIYPLTG